jgi:hypothetical protein
VDVEAVGGGGEGLGEDGDFGGVEARAGVVVGAKWTAVEGSPVVANVEEFGLVRGFDGGLLLFEETALGVGDFLGGVDADLFRVELEEGWVVLDFGTRRRGQRCERRRRDLRR